MEISSGTTSEEVKKSTLENIDKIPNMVFNYADGVAPSKDDTSNEYWLHRICNSHFNG